MNRLLIIDDHRIFTDGIRFLIENTTDFKVVGVSHSGKNALSFIENTKPDIILLDIDLPDITGFEVGAIVKRTFPYIKILALSMLDDAGSMERMLSAGVDGFCVKSDGQEEVFRALHTLQDGGTYWPPSYLRLLLNKKEKISEVILTSRETEITRLICKGITSSEIATKLYLSTRTVETHRRNIYRKVAVHNNVELIQYAKKHLII